MTNQAAVKVGGRYRKSEAVAVVKKVEATRVQVLQMATGEREFIDLVEFAATYRSAEVR